MSWFVLAMAMLSAQPGPENPVFRQLVATGLCAHAEGQHHVRLPEPTMVDGLDAAAQRQRIEKLAGPNRRIEDLLRNSVVAPFVLKIEDLPPVAGGDLFRRVEVGYVAYGPLEKFFSESFFEQMLHLAPSEKKTKLPLTSHLLAEEELRKRNIACGDREGYKERYYFSTTALFDRVLLSATRRVVVTRQPDSVLVAAVIDARFANDPEYPNRWQSITLDASGQFRLGPAQPYEASGTYTKITRLHQPDGALFIEHHQALAEPEGWFGGTHLLRSKLPLAVQDGVRKLRRQLRAAQGAP